MDEVWTCILSEKKGLFYAGPLPRTIDQDPGTSEEAKMEKDRNYSKQKTCMARKCSIKSLKNLCFLSLKENNYTYRV